MTIEEMIKKYDIRLASEDRIGMYNTNAVTRDGMYETIAAKKPEIIAYLKAEQEEKEKAEADRKAKIAAIDGLAEIRDAINAETEYRIAFDKMMDDEYNDGVFPPKKPTASSKDLMSKYPRAAAYLKAESWSYSEHFVKSAAGRKAMDRIINGDDYEQAIADMDKEFSTYCMEHMWD